MSRVSPKTLDEVCALLKLDAPARDEFTRGVFKIAAQYDVDTFAAECMGPAKEQKRVIAQAIGAIDRTLGHLDRLTSDFESALEMLSTEGVPEGPKIDLLTTKNDLYRVREVSEAFLRRYKPAKGAAPDLSLEGAVDSLLALIETMLKHPIKIYADKAAGTPPEARSPGAEALVMIIGVIRPGTSTGALLNTIEKIRSLRQSISPYLAILDASDPLPA